MKKILFFRPNLLVLTFLLLCCKCGFAGQRADMTVPPGIWAKDTARAIKLTSLKNGKVEYFRVGDEIKYKTKHTTAFRKAKIVSIEAEKMELKTLVSETGGMMSVELAHTDLESIKKLGTPPKKIGIRVLSMLLGLVGAFFLIVLAFAGGIAGPLFAGIAVGVLSLVLPWVLFRNVQKIGKRYRLEVV